MRTRPLLCSHLRELTGSNDLAKSCKRRAELRLPPRRTSTQPEISLKLHFWRRVKLAARQEVKRYVMNSRHPGKYNDLRENAGTFAATFTQTWPSATYDTDTAWPTRRLQPSIDNEWIAR